jgi:hypothetical protein
LSCKLWDDLLYSKRLLSVETGSEKLLLKMPLKIIKIFVGAGQLYKSEGME